MLRILEEMGESFILPLNLLHGKIIVKIHTLRPEVAQWQVKNSYSQNWSQTVRLQPCLLLFGVLVPYQLSTLT